MGKKKPAEGGGGEEKSDKPSAGKQDAPNPEPAEAPESLLARLRPRRRVVFFLGFVGFCLWIMAFYEPCQVDSKSRRDCGYAGVSSAYCITGSCFTSRGGKLEKKTVKVERKKGGTLGLEVKKEEKGDLVLVRSVGAGAVQAYNDQLPADSDQRIRSGDVIAKVDGSAKNLAEALARSGEKLVELEVRRSSLPSYLMWLRTSTKPGPIESVLTAPGFKRWSSLTTQLGTLGLSCWLLSGYGAASLPVWYFGFSSAVAYKLVRCCHDESVSQGVPHCYKPADDDISKVVEKAWASSSGFALRTLEQWRSFADEVMGASAGKKDTKKKKKDKKEKGK